MLRRLAGKKTDRYAAHWRWCKIRREAAVGVSPSGLITQDVSILGRATWISAVVHHTFYIYYWQALTAHRGVGGDHGCAVSLAGDCGQGDAQGVGDGADGSTNRAGAAPRQRPTVARNVVDGDVGGGRGWWGRGVVLCSAELNGHNGQNGDEHSRARHFRKLGEPTECDCGGEVGVMGEVTLCSFCGRDTAYNLIDVATRGPF